jgi:hypothetical protein
MGLRGRRESDEHREFEDMAVAHVVGGLSVDQGRLFRSHLLECPSCRARVGELRAIAHDLADVERDERRLRTAKRTETKAHEGEDGDAAVAATPRLSGRATLLMAAGLTILMALSAWNFVLRGRLQQAEQAMNRLRQSVGVLQDGEEWEVSSSSSGVDGQVSTLDRELVIRVDGLTNQKYGIYLLDSDDATVDRMHAATIDGLLYEYFVDPDLIETAHRVLVIRTPELTPNPDGPTVFEARRYEAHSEVYPQPVVEPAG